jgi:hypothetical protein
MPHRPKPTGRWPEHLAVGALRVGRSSAHDDQAVRFYQELVGLPVLERFAAGYGGDGTAFGLPDAAAQLEVVRAAEPDAGVDRTDSLGRTCRMRRPGAVGRTDGGGRCGACGAAPLLGRERWRDLPGPGRARGRVRVVGLRAGPDLTAPY